MAMGVLSVRRVWRACVDPDVEYGCRMLMDCGIREGRGPKFIKGMLFTRRRK